MVFRKLDVWLESGVSNSNGKTQNALNGELNLSLGEYMGSDSISFLFFFIDLHQFLVVREAQEVPRRERERKKKRVIETGRQSFF